MRSVRRTLGGSCVCQSGICSCLCRRGVGDALIRGRLSRCRIGECRIGRSLRGRRTGINRVELGEVDCVGILRTRREIGQLALRPSRADRDAIAPVGERAFTQSNATVGCRDRPAADCYSVGTRGDRSGACAVDGEIAAARAQRTGKRGIELRLVDGIGAARTGGKMDDPAFLAVIADRDRVLFIGHRSFTQRDRVDRKGRGVVAQCRAVGGRGDGIVAQRGAARTGPIMRRVNRRDIEGVLIGSRKRLVRAILSGGRIGQRGVRSGLCRRCGSSVVGDQPVLGNILGQSLIR